MLPFRLLKACLPTAPISSGRHRKTGIRPESWRCNSSDPDNGMGLAINVQQARVHASSVSEKIFFTEQRTHPNHEAQAQAWFGTNGSPPLCDGPRRGYVLNPRQRASRWVASRPISTAPAKLGKSLDGSRLCTPSKRLCHLPGKVRDSDRSGAEDGNRMRRSAGPHKPWCPGPCFPENHHDTGHCEAPVSDVETVRVAESACWINLFQGKQDEDLRSDVRSRAILDGRS